MASYPNDVFTPSDGYRSSYGLIIDIIFRKESRPNQLSCKNEKSRNVRKRTFRTCAPSEDSDQPAHSRSLIRIFTGTFEKPKMRSVFRRKNEDADETALMHWLIWVVVGRICQYVPCLELRLKYFRILKFLEDVSLPDRSNKLNPDLIFTNTSY